MSSDALGKTAVLGDEYDSELRSALKQTLRELGAFTLDHWNGMGGSQEVEVLEVVIGGEQLEVEAETFVGLSVSGSAQMVDKIVDEVRAKLARRIV
jgi:hypothetical protein